MKRILLLPVVLGMLVVALYSGVSPVHAAATDARVKFVVAEPSYDVDVSVSTLKTVRVGIENRGPVVADLGVVLLLKSRAGVCEARWIAQPGDSRVEDNIGGEIQSELDITLLGMLPGETREIVRDYTVHCFSKSFHDNAIELDIGVAPVLPASESNPMDNAYHQNIDITAQGIADVNYLGIVVDPETLTLFPGSTVLVRSVLHNYGPFGPVSALVSVTPSLPADCTLSPLSALSTTVNLPVSVAVSLDQTPAVTCTEISFHELCWAGVVVVQDLHVEESSSANNSAAACATYPVIGTHDLKIAGLTITSPATAEPGVGFTVTVDAIVHNNGPYGPLDAAGSVSFSVPLGCSADPTTPQSFVLQTLPVSVATTVSRAWMVACPDVGVKGFSAAATVATAPVSHLSDSDTGNNSATASGSTSVSVPPPGPPLAIGGAAGLKPAAAQGPPGAESGLLAAVVLIVPVALMLSGAAAAWVVRPRLRRD